MSSRILFVDAQRKEEINALRIEAYQNVSGFIVEPSALMWKKSDDDSVVMALEKNGKLISTMRGEVIEDVELLEKKLECPWVYPLSLEMPILLISRAATLHAHRNLRLSLLMRYWFLQIALAYGIRFIVCTFVAGSSREHILRDMGYQFFENTLGWRHSTYLSLRPVIVAVLDLANDAEYALAYCRHHCAILMSEYVMDVSFPAMRIVRGL